jgi:alpha-1,2-mannosyltransferase
MLPAIRLRIDDAQVSPPTPRRALGAPKAVLIVLSLVTAALGSVGWTIHRRQVDIQVYLMGARHLTSAHLYSLYLPGVHLPFTYPPFSTLFFWPLTLVSTGVATVVWAIVNLAALVTIIGVTLMTVHPEMRAGAAGVPWATVAMLIGPAVLIEPVMLDMSFGQINLVLVALVLLDATTRVGVGRRTLPRGVGIGIAAAIKLVPVIFVPYLLVTRQFRAVLTTLVTIVVCTLAAFALNPSASAAFWTRYVNDQARIGTVTYVSNQSLEGALDRVTHHLWSSPAMESLQALVVVLGIALSWWAWRTSSTFLAVLIVADAGLLASPITWAHHMVWIVPVLMWLWWGSDRPAGARWWALGAATLFYVAPMWILAHGPAFDTHERGWTLLASNSFAMAALVFMVGVAMWLWRRRKTS